jgi:acyl-CoA reductase-like NAD-dependent aldehyde dehydrogenase
MNSYEMVACRDRVTNELLGTEALHQIGDVRRAVERARLAQKSWAATPLEARIKSIESTLEFVATHADELAETVARSTGKTLTEAMSTEIVPSVVAARYYAENARRFLMDHRVKPSNRVLFHKKTRLRRVPWGVVGVVSPGSYPFADPFSKIVMGLLAGNAVVVEAATSALMVGRALKRCFRAVDLPVDAVAVVNSPEPDGAWLLESGVNKLFFSGATPVGKQVMARAARTLTPVSMELDGSDAMLVCADADLERAAAGAVWAGVQSCGLARSSVKRIYVHKDVHDRFVNYVGERVRELRVGLDSRLDVDLSSIVAPDVVADVAEKVKDALDKGAVIWSESDEVEEVEGDQVRATLLVRVDQSMRIMREETHGPLIGVMKVDDIDRAVELANDSELGLTASVWSRDHRRAQEIARRIQAGVVMINDHMLSHAMPEVPWGGFKASGIGRTHGELGFAEMTQPQCIVDDHLHGAKRNMWWYPHDDAVYEGMHGVIDLLYSHNIWRRISGLRRVMRIFPKALVN